MFGTDDVRICGSVITVRERIPSVVNSPWPTSKSRNATLGVWFRSELRSPRQNMLFPTFFEPITSVTERSHAAIVFIVYGLRTRRRTDVDPRVIKGHEIVKRHLWNQLCGQYVERRQKRRSRNRVITRRRIGSQQITVRVCGSRATHRGTSR